MTRVPKPPVVEKVRKPLQRTGRIARTSRLTPKARKPSETLRIYGTPEFQEWARRQPCAVCGCVGYTELAHTVNGGKGRKADWTTIAPLCGPHAVKTVVNTFFMVPGCHRESHQMGTRAFAMHSGCVLTDLAKKTQRRWIAHRAVANILGNKYPAPSPGVDPQY